MKSSLRKWIGSNWLALILLGASVFQLSILLPPQAGGLTEILKGNLPRSAIERSAYFAFGKDFEGYVVFLRSHIPADSLVIVPPDSADYILGNQFIAQYFLFPRRVANCSQNVNLDTCVASLTGSTTYILSVGGFPSRRIATAIKDYIAFDDARGVFVPRPEGQ